MQIGYKLATEAFGPQEIVRQAQRAEQAGFDFVEMSDHYHPWFEAQGHSGFTWSMLGAVATTTTDIGIVVGVTCPSFRYHPAIIAQAAATVAILSDGRFTLGLGAGERLNEHVTGQEFPPPGRRHDALREAIEVIRLLWTGGYRTYEGNHVRIEDARVFDLPKRLPTVPVAASGPASAAIAAELGDGLFATDADSSLVANYHAAGGSGPCYGEVPLAWAPHQQEAAKAALRTNSWALGGWNTMSELPNPQHFAAAASTVRIEDITASFACGPDPQTHIQAAQKYSDAGFDHLVLMNAGPDPDGFLDFYSGELAGPLHALTPA